MPATFAMLLRHRAIVAVLALYAASAIVVPTMTPVAISDDWVYTRSVEILVRQHELRVLDLSVVTLVFQVAWGGLFATVFGMSFGALRISTVVLTAIGGLAFYGLCLELGVDRLRSAFGTAAYLFNPLAFVLGFTFMSDPHFAALLVIATFFYARGLRPGRTGNRAVIAGSAVSAAAFLVRQQGALIPFAVVVFLLFSRRVRPDRAGLVALARAVAIPVAVVGVYYGWLTFVSGVPSIQTQFLENIEQAGVGGSWELLRRMTYIEMMYVGLCVVPVVAAALGGGWRPFRPGSRHGWVLVAAWAIPLAIGLVAFTADGRRMPYIPQFVHLQGLGPGDLRGGRPWPVDPAVADWLTYTCAVASIAFAAMLARRIATLRTDHTAALTVMIGFGQVIGIMPPSYHFRNWIISVDRYLLPLLPFALALGLWALRGARLSLPVGWLVVAAIGLVSVAGTRDMLVFQQAVWDMARTANALGVKDTRLDAGAAWDGYHLYEYSRAHGIPTQTKGGPWWTDLFGPATDSSYVVATSPQQVYDVVLRTEYSSWIQRESVYVYLLRRQGVAGPP
ncbi:MAG: hypothetical protein QOF33_2342 [Thermomicrobiales bacterium]|nr:hypothetical protein [Thermomicrobiales bacterium]